MASGIFLSSAAPAAEELKASLLNGPARVGAVCEFVVDASVTGGDPYDPCSMALDATIAGPGGGARRVPGFFMVPHVPQVTPAPEKVVNLVRLFFDTGNFHPGQKVAMLVDDIRLVRRDGTARVFDGFEGEPAWQAVGLEAKIETGAGNVHEGKRALRIDLSVPKANQWPGVNWRPGSADWRDVTEIRMWICPLEGLDKAGPKLEFWNPAGEKFQDGIDISGSKVGQWQEVSWPVPDEHERVRFVPAAGDAGKAQWRVRFMPAQSGAHKASFAWKGPAGAGAATLEFAVVASSSERLAAELAPRSAGLQAGGGPGTGTGTETAKGTPPRSQSPPTDPVRVSPKDHRYLAFADGTGFFPVGANLLGHELGHYRHYLDHFAEHGINFVRVWLSPATLGVEVKPGRYEQDRAAQFDALIDECRRRGQFLMVCFTDYREVCLVDRSGYWGESPFNAAKGGPCKKPEDFFTDAAAWRMYENKLRYQVARWSAYPTILAWEFFNEVDITDGWKKSPDSVRAWHQRMAGRLATMDPTGRLITSSFSGVADDPLWDQPGMRIAQRHMYLHPGSSFVTEVAEGTRLLGRHGKPVLVGEFGRPDEVPPASDVPGVALHNGLWSSVMSGGAGAAMSWWWDIIDRYNQWSRYDSIVRFIEGVDFPAEGFVPLVGGGSTSLTASVSATPAAGERMPPRRIVSDHESWKPAPYNQPVRLAVGPGDSPDKSELLPRVLHGLKNHRVLHNPVTFLARYVRAGTFTVNLDEVSKHGGSGLSVNLDGNDILRKDFPYKDPNDPLRPYAGRYSVPIPAGTHEITVEAVGNDWLNVSAYELDGVETGPPAELLGLRGKRTVLAWLWNRTHIWAPSLTGWQPVRLSAATAELRELPPGTWRVRPFDPWKGQWAPDREVTGGADGVLRLSVDGLDRDWAWRLERK